MALEGTWNVCGRLCPAVRVSVFRLLNSSVVAGEPKRLKVFEIRSIHAGWMAGATCGHGAAAMEDAGKKQASGTISRASRFIGPVAFVPMFPCQPSGGVDTGRQWEQNLNQ